MALKKQTLSLSFEKGLNQKASDRVLNVPHMADIQNGRMEKSGEIRRRAGLEPLQNDNLPNNGKFDEVLASTSYKIPTVSNVSSYRDGLAWMDGKHLYQNLGDNAYSRQGVCDPVVMNNQVIRDDRGITQSRPELCKITNATYGNFICAVWYEIDCTSHGATQDNYFTEYSVYAQLYDADTDVEVGRRQLVDTCRFETLGIFEDERAYLAPKPKVLALENKFVILYNSVDVTNTGYTLGDGSYPVLLNYRLIDITASNWQLGDIKPSTSTSLVALHPTAAWDACSFIRAVDTPVEGIAIFWQTSTEGSESKSFKLREVVLDGTSLSFTSQRTFDIAQSAQARFGTSVAEYGLNNPQAYGVFVRHFHPNLGHANPVNRDDLSHYVIGFNALDTTIRGRFAVVDAATGTLSLEGSVINAPDNEGMLNGTAILDPSASPSTHTRVYYVTDTKVDARAPNVTTLRSIKFTIADATAAHSVLAYNTGLTSDPWTYDDEVYFMGSECIAQQAGTSWDASYQNFSEGSTYIFRDTFSEAPGSKNYKRDRCMPVAKTAEGDVGANPFTDFFLLQRDFSKVDNGELASTMYYGASAVIDGKTPDQKLIGSSRWAPLLVGEEVTFAASIATVQHKPRRELPTVETNNSLLIGGGYLKTFDGQAVHENGFFRAPQIFATPTYAAASNSSAINGMTARITTGVRTYTAIYEFVDAAGNLHRSKPSDPITVDITADNNQGWIKVKVYTYNHSLRYNENVRIVLYRSTATQATHYRIGDIANNWDSPSVEFLDVYADADIFPVENPKAAHEVLYSDFEKANGCLGSVTDLVIHKDRLMFATADNRVHTSKPTVNTLATEVFTDAEFQFGQLEGGREKVYGIETTGDHLVVFTPENVFVISGEGPDANGGTARFTEPRLLVKGQGALEGTIHINSPRGILYQAERGFYNINRELQSEYIGAPVEDLGIYRGLATELDDSKHELYIPLGDRLDGSSDPAGYSTVLVYNYFFDAWSQYTFDKTYVGYNSKGLKLLNGVLHYGRMRYASYSGRTATYDLDSSIFSGVWKVDETKFWDAKYGSTSGDIYSKYTTVIETPYIYTNNLQGAQRIYKVQFLGDHKGDHDVTVEMTVDYNDSTAHSQTKTASTFIDKHCYQVPVKRQKSRALKVKHTITPNAASTITNEMFRMDGMALEVGFRPTTFALPKGDQI